MSDKINGIEFDGKVFRDTRRAGVEVIYDPYARSIEIIETDMSKGIDKKKGMQIHTVIDLNHKEQGVYHTWENAKSEKGIVQDYTKSTLSPRELTRYEKMLNQIEDRWHAQHPGHIEQRDKDVKAFVDLRNNTLWEEQDEAWDEKGNPTQRRISIVITRADGSMEKMTYHEKLAKDGIWEDIVSKGAGNTRYHLNFKAKDHVVDLDELSDEDKKRYQEMIQKAKTRGKTSADQDVTSEDKTGETDDWTKRRNDPIQRALRGVGKQRIVREIAEDVDANGRVFHRTISDIVLGYRTGMPATRYSYEQELKNGKWEDILPEGYGKKPMGPEVREMLFKGLDDGKERLHVAKSETLSAEDSKKYEDIYNKQKNKIGDREKNEEIVKYNYSGDDHNKIVTKVVKTPVDYKGKRYYKQVVTEYHLSAEQGEGYFGKAFTHEELLDSSGKVIDTRVGSERKWDKDMQKLTKQHLVNTKAKSVDSQGNECLFSYMSNQEIKYYTAMWDKDNKDKGHGVPPGKGEKGDPGRDGKDGETKIIHEHHHHYEKSSWWKKLFPWLLPVVTSIIVFFGGKNQKKVEPSVDNRPVVEQRVNFGVHQESRQKISMIKLDEVKKMGFTLIQKEDGTFKYAPDWWKHVTKENHQAWQQLTHNLVRFNNLIKAGKVVYDGDHTCGVMMNGHLMPLLDLGKDYVAQQQVQGAVKDSKNVSKSRTEGSSLRSTVRKSTTVTQTKTVARAKAADSVVINGQKVTKDSLVAIQVHPMKRVQGLGSGKGGNYHLQRSSKAVIVYVNAADLVSSFADAKGDSLDGLKTIVEGVKTGKYTIETREVGNAAGDRVDTAALRAKDGKYNPFKVVSSKRAHEMNAKSKVRLVDPFGVTAIQGRTGLTK